MRWLIAALTALAGLTAGLNEVASLDRFAADRLNFPPALPWTLPGMVTVGTVAGALMWTCLRQTALRRAGRRLNITCAAVSALAVGLDHASGAVGWWVIPAGLIGGMVPALATWMTHLLARVTGEHSQSDASAEANALASEFGLTVAAAAAPTFVYRLFSAEGVLLYVGITADLKSRLARHKAKKNWWPQVDEVTTERYPNRAAALAVEQSAIANEHPLHNKAKGGLKDAVGGVVNGRVERQAMKVTPPPTPVEAPADTSSAAPDAPVAVVDDDLARAIELVDAGRANGRRYGRGQLARDLGCTPDRARKLLERIDDERPVRLVGAS